MLILFLCVNASCCLQAASGTTWVSATNGAWAKASNWNPATVPNASSAVVIFGNSPPAVDTTNVISGGTNTPFTFGTLISSNGVVLNGNGGQLNAVVTNGTPVINVVNSGSLWFYALLGGTQGFNKTGNGTLTFRYNNNNNPISGNIIISGGTLTLNVDSNLGNAGNDVIFSNNATLQFNPTTAAPCTLSAGRWFTLACPAAVMDVTGTNWLGVPGVIDESVTGSGFVKTSSGTLSLSGANIYSGNTTINGGTLALGSGGTLAKTAQVTLADGTTFDVSAAGFTFSGASPQQTLAGPAAGGTGSINAGSQTVTLNVGALLNLQAAGGGTSTVGNLGVTGNLTLNGNVVTVNVTGAALAAGVYRLLDCTGTLTGSANATPTITGTALSSGYTATVFTSAGAGGYVDLIVMGASTINTWTSGVEGPWGAAGNWNPTTVPNAPDTVVIFGNSPPAIDTTNVTGTPFTFGTLISSNGMVLNGGGQLNAAVTSGTPIINVVNNGALWFYALLGGTQGFNKTGNGTLTFRYNNNNNPISGNVIISGGTLTFNVDSNLGNSGNDVIISNNATLQFNPTTAAPCTLNSGRWLRLACPAAVMDVTGTNWLGVAGVMDELVAGSGFVKTSSGTLSLSGANTYSGNTTINGGTLALGSGGSVNSTALISIGAGATYDVSAISSYSLGGNTALTATGNASPATLIGASSGVVNLGTRPITLNFDGSNPVLVIPQGNLSLGGQTITVNASALSAGTYNLIQVNSGNLSHSGNYTLNGTATNGTLGGTIGFATNAGIAYVQMTITTLSSEFDALRTYWETNWLIGNPSGSTLINWANTASNYWSTLNTSPSRTNLWSDLPLGSVSANMDSSFGRLEAMALAWAAPGCSLQGNAALASAITNSLDWMCANVYTTTATEYDNWWDWEIGGLHNLNNAAVLIYPALTPTQIANYNSSADHFLPPTKSWDTGANLTDQCLGVIIRAILSKNSGKMAYAQTNLSPVFLYVTSADGFYRDGSFIQHTTHPYTEGYGRTVLGDVSELVNLLNGSTWQITDSNLTNVYNWVFQSFEPVTYRGEAMDMVRGRYISRGPNSPTGAQGFAAGVEQFAPPAISNAIATWATTASLPPSQYQFASMDRVVAWRSNFCLGLSMSSSRIANWESGGEDLHGWFTGDGMTYLYLGTPDSQFTSDFWPTVDSYHLPGTTEEEFTRANGAGDNTKTGQPWVGGAQVANSYGVSGMSVAAYGTTLTAKKSWFMFDNEIVCIGAGITCGDASEVDTTVEDRRLGLSPTNKFTVNGVANSPVMGWSSNLTNVSWCALDGVAGYYFPDGATNLRAAFVANTGKWADITYSTPYDNNIHTNDYLTLWFNHGNKPTNSTYSYVILPNFTASNMATYAASPDIVVLTNTTTVQAASKSSLGVVAANFWVDGTNSADLITVNKKAAVITLASGSQLSVGVSDPTQTNTSTISVTLNYSAGSLVSADPGVTVVQLTPKVVLSVNVNGSLGKTYQATFGSVVKGMVVKSNATLSSSLPLTSIARQADGRLSLTINGDANQNYTILGSSNCVASVWETLFTTNPPTMPFQWTDTNVSRPQFFYRVLQVPKN